MQEALEISRKELSGNDVHKQAATGQKIPENGANGHIQEVLSNPKKSEGILLHLNAFFFENLDKSNKELAHHLI